MMATVLNRHFLVVAKGAEATCLAKVDSAPFYAEGSVVERSKPFNTSELVDFAEYAVQFPKIRIVNL